MARLFLNYRRRETQHAAGRLFLQLQKLGFRQGEIFIDVVSIRGGVDFEQAFTSEVQSADVLVAMFGHQWAELARNAGAEDYALDELRAASARSMPILPVLVDNAAMPAKGEIPADLDYLRKLNAYELRHTTFPQDVARIAAAARDLAGDRSSPVLTKALSDELAIERDRVSDTHRRLNRSGAGEETLVWLDRALQIELEAIEHAYRGKQAREMAKLAEERAKASGENTKVERTTYSSGGEGIYAGEFLEGRKSGFAVFRAPYAGGGAYEYAGEWSDGDMRGYGVHTAIGPEGDRTVIEGQFHGGKAHGSGVISSSNGHAYRGQFSGGERHGVGVYLWGESGGRRAAEYSFGEQTGIGVHHDREGKLVSSGTWLKGDLVQAK